MVKTIITVRCDQCGKEVDKDLFYNDRGITVIIGAKREPSIESCSNPNEEHFCDYKCMLKMLNAVKEIMTS